MFSIANLIEILVGCFEYENLLRFQIHCHDVVIEDTDITKAITEYISHTAIENLVLGAPTKHAFIR